MNCPKCNTFIENDVVFCPRCGADLRNIKADSHSGGEGRYSPAVSPAADTAQAQDLTPTLPFEGKMKWYKFIIYFQLFVFAALSLYSAFNIISGAQFGEYAESVYDRWHSVQIIDYIYGAATFGFGVWAIFVRQELKKFKAKGPLHYYLVTGIGGVAITVLYYFALSFITKFPLSELFDKSSLSNITVCICLLIYNIRYFRERAELFVN